MSWLNSGASSQMHQAFPNYMQQGQGSMGQMAEGVMGGAMSRGGAVAGPVMQGASAMMGLDPMSMGMKAASFGWNRMGMGALGAGAMGMGAMGGVAMLGMGAQYAGGQMMQGAQDQMAFNNTMRQSFSHVGAAGQGFGRADLSSISGTLRGMTQQYGPGGEANSFGELTKLAGNMGKMGMTDGVRDAQSFSKKFKEMVSTLKTVATELGTSLEAAQELMSSSRGSGIFKTTDQLKFSGQIRQLGLAGGLATSELTGMANVGSRISRSVGGLGRSGAFAGMKALGQVGLATQVGALSEEDIYNATGATGAEGRAAMATEMLQNSAKFMRTGKGRYFLASVSGKDGKINAESAAEYMMGGVGTGRTSQMAHENLNGMGRANFIRNEGRLRGAAMEEFGAMMPTMALMNWGRQRGININNMDDRSMLFAQHQLGMGRDEMDAAVKMANSMPEMLAEQRRVKQGDKYSQGMAQTAKTSGVQGFKTRLEHVRHEIQSKLQKSGADLFDQGSNMIEGYFNEMSGQYARSMNKELDHYYNAIKSGGGKGAMNAFTKGTVSGTNVMGVSQDRIKANDTFKLQQQIAKDATSDAATDKVVAGGLGDALTSSMMRGEQGGDAISQRANTIRLLSAQAKAGDKGAQALMEKYKTSSPEQRVGIAAAIEKSAGISGDNQLSKKFDALDVGNLDAATGGFRTERDRQVAMGEMAMGKDAGSTLQAFAGGATRFATGLIGLQALEYVAHGNTKISEGLAAGAEGLAGKNANQQFVGARLLSKGGLKDMAAVSSGDATAIKRMQGEVMTLMGGKSFDQLEGTMKADVLNRKEMIVGSMITHEMKAQNLTAATITQEQKQAIIRKSMGAAGYDKASAEGALAGNFDDFMAKRDAFAGAFDRNELENIRDLGRRTQADRKDREDEFTKTGVASVGKDGGLKLTAETREKLKNSLDPKGTPEYASLGLKIGKLALKASEGFKTGVSPEADRAALAEWTNVNEDLGGLISGLTLKQKQELASGVGKGNELGARASDSAMREQRLQSLADSNAKQFGKAGSAEAGVAALFGVKGGKDLQKKLAGGGGVEEILKQAGVTPDMLEGEQGADVRKNLTSALDAAKGGKMGVAADLASKAIDNASPEVREQIKKANQGENDPLMASIEKNANKQTGYLELMAKQAGVDGGLLAQIASGQKANPDAPFGPPKPP